MYCRAEQSRATLAPKPSHRFRKSRVLLIALAAALLLSTPFVANDTASAVLLTTTLGRVSNSVHVGLAIDANGDYITLTESGRFCRYNPRTRVTTPISWVGQGVFAAFAIDGNGDYIALARFGQVYRFNPGTRSGTRVGRVGSLEYAGIAIDSNGDYIVLATYGYLDRFNPGTGVTTVIGRAGPEILHAGLTIDANGDYITMTKYGWLYRLSRTQVVTSLGRIDGRSHTGPAAIANGDRVGRVESRVQNVHQADIAVDPNGDYITLTRNGWLQRSFEAESVPVPTLKDICLRVVSKQYANDLDALGAVIQKGADLPIIEPRHPFSLPRDLLHGLIDTRLPARSIEEQKRRACHHEVERYWSLCKLRENSQRRPDSRSARRESNCVIQ